LPARFSSAWRLDQKTADVVHRSVDAGTPILRHQEPAPRCWFGKFVPAARSSDCCTSGVVADAGYRTVA